MSKFPELWPYPNLQCVPTYVRQVWGESPFLPLLKIKRPNKIHLMWMSSTSQLQERHKTQTTQLIRTGAFLDVAQAFGRVWHISLLFKFQSISPSYFYLIFKSYLEDRHFTVYFGFSISDISSICVGVQQGAVAAPLLFNLFTVYQITTSNTILLADDKALLVHHSDPEIASQLIQRHQKLLSI